VREEVFKPIPENRKVYERLFALYRRVHDAFGVQNGGGDLYSVMKELLEIRSEARR
jgi:L-ribulokinase